MSTVFTQWRGSSDSETLVEALEAFGVEASLDRLVGMFAFALWDRRDRRLVLARDRLGEKPLYFSRSDQGITFASELAPLRVLLGDGARPEAREIDAQALAQLVGLGATLGQSSIIRGISKLPPGCTMTWDSDDLDAPATVDTKPRRYWPMPWTGAAGGLRDASLGDAAAIELIDRAITDAVSGQLMAEVPLGAFLSGGIDSTLVVAKMAEASATPVRTFSIGFESADHDEAPYAKEIARQLGTLHTERYVTQDDLLALAPMLPFVGGEPFADPSMLPTLLVCALAREHVTVALSGDGADELFAGYDRYRLSSSIERVPSVARTLIGAGVRIAELRWFRPIFERSRRGAQRPGEHKMQLTSSRLRMLRRALLAPDPEDRYHALLRSPLLRSLVRVPMPESHALTGAGAFADLDHLDAMLATDLQGYLVDDILVKVDRAAMHVSLETRMPFLDHRVVEAAWRLPHRMLVRDGRTKWVLREILARYVSPELTERPKAGFGVPLAPWLRGPLRPWAEELISVGALEEHGLLETDEVRRLWREHSQREADRSRELWPILMFQGWINGTPEERQASIPAEAPQ